jgi:hypothetical protein
MGVRVNTNKSCPYSEMRGKSMRKKLDGGITITPKRGRIAGPLAKVGPAYCLSLMLLAFQAISIQSSEASMNLKLYAYNKMDWSEFQCYNWLIFKESSWNPKARNGSHYGLGQMRSTWYRDLSPKRQIDAHIKYVRHRYKDACDALHHLETRGWH